MIRADCPDGDVRTYAYDPFGRRISKACNHTKVTFIWDGDVIAREITETRERVDVVDWFFEPGSFRPMARLEAGDLTHVINDHLGTPKEVVGGDGSLRWSADHDTWGTLRTKRGAMKAQVETGDYWVEPTSIEGNTVQAYAPNPEALYCPIRFQGQWEDCETGLYYNRFRYYEPTLGRYASSDPVGLLGGSRSTGYVSVPSKLLDPFGLETIDPMALNFSQRSVGMNTVDYIEAIRAGQWDWARSGPLRVMERNGQLVSFDNRRLYAAQEVGINEVPIERVQPDQIVPGSDPPRTWGDVFDERLSNNRLGCCGRSARPALMNRRTREAAEAAGWPD